MEEEIKSIPYPILLTKKGKIYTCFQTKMVQKPYPLQRHVTIWLILGSTPPVPLGLGGSCDES